MGLEHKVIGRKEVLDCENGRFPVGRHVVRDTHPIGTATIADVLVRSSNVCMAKLGFRLGRTRLYEGYLSLVLVKRLGLSLRGSLADFQTS